MTSSQGTMPLLYIAQHGHEATPSRLSTWSFLLMDTNTTGTLHRIKASLYKPDRPRPDHLYTLSKYNYSLEPPISIDFTKAKVQKQKNFLDFGVISGPHQEPAIQFEREYDLAPHLIFLGAFYVADLDTKSRGRYQTFRETLAEALPCAVRVNSDTEWNVSQRWVVNALRGLAKAGCHVESLTKDEIIHKFEGEKRKQSQLIYHLSSQ